MFKASYSPADIQLLWALSVTNYKAKVAESVTIQKWSALYKSLHEEIKTQPTWKCLVVSKSEQIYKHGFTFDGYMCNCYFTTIGFA